MNPYAIVGALVGSILLFAAGAGTGAHFTALSYKASIAKQSAEAATLLDQLDKTAAAKDSATAEFSRNLEAEHANQIQAVSATADAFRNALAERVRDTERRQGGSCTVPAAPVKASIPANPPTGGDSGSAGIDAERLSQAVDIAEKLQADVKLCWAWAKGIGR